MFEESQKKAEPKEATQIHFASWQFSIAYGKIGSRNVGGTQLVSFSPCGLFTGLGSFRLPFACIDWSRTCWVAPWFVRRCEKMVRRIVHSKMGRFLLAWYLHITRKMVKIYNKSWSILWIKHFLSFYRIWRFFFLKKDQRFILVHLVLQLCNQAMPSKRLKPW